MGKVMSAVEAVADIEDGASVGIAGFGLSHRYPSTLISALGEKGSRGLTVYCNGLGQPGFPTGHLLADNHQIGRLVTCFSARPGVVSEAEKQILAGEMTLEMVPQGTLVERMRAGGAGLAAIYTPTGYGSQIADGKDIRYFDGRPYVLERAITTDFALIRAARADHFGNVSFRGGSQNFNVSFAKAARVTIVEAEEIVPTGEIPPHEVDLPGVFVTRVVPITVAMDIRNLPPRANRPATSAREYLGKPALSRAEIGRRAAALLPDDAVVNLGAGLPVQVANWVTDASGGASCGERAAQLRRVRRGRGLRPRPARRGRHVHHDPAWHLVLRLGDVVRDRARRQALRGHPRVLPGRRERRPGELGGAWDDGRRHRRRDGPRRGGAARVRDARAHRLPRRPEAAWNGATCR